MTEPLIDWIDGQPFSGQYGDIYFSRGEGLQESRHVFIEGNNLLSRWSELAAGSSFVIGETGFGTGLNFLVTWQSWQRYSIGNRLHYVSFEKHPLSTEQLRRAHTVWPELADFSGELCDQYRTPGAGWHRFEFQRGEVTLTLIIGDARTNLPRLSGKVNAWYLDGFSPARNPDMWEAGLLREIGAHSRPGSTLATFTSAGAVRRSLQAAGFAVEKRKGYGRKREMTVARIEPMGDSAAAPPSRDAIVVGAGIAGSATARALAQRGWRVVLLDRADGAAGGASGLPQATLHLRLPKNMHRSHRLAVQGYQHSTRLWTALARSHGVAWQPCGTLQLDHVSRRILDQTDLEDAGLPMTLARRVSMDEASQIAGLPVPSGGIYFPGGGWIDGRATCEALCDHPLIVRKFGQEVQSMNQPDGDNPWRLECRSGGSYTSRTVIFANAGRASHLLRDSHLTLHEVRGQITLAAETAASRHLRTVLCGEGVLTPALRGNHTIGATYRHGCADLLPQEQEHDENRRMLQKLCPSAFKALGLEHVQPLGAFMAFRTTTPDRTPVAGPCHHPSGPGIYLNLAHGSRGYTTAPLLGEYVASCIEGEPSPLPADIEAAVDAGRFGKVNLD